MALKAVLQRFSPMELLQTFGDPPHRTLCPAAAPGCREVGEQGGEGAQLVVPHTWDAGWARHGLGKGQAAAAGGTGR